MTEEELVALLKARAALDSMPVPKTGRMAFDPITGEIWKEKNR